MYSRTTLYSFIILVLLIVSCGRKTSSEEAGKIQIDPRYSEYITAMTSGVISSQSDIRIILAEPFKGNKEELKDLADLFDFSPRIKGSARWVDNRTIEFNPEENLESGETYKGVFEIGELVELPHELEEFEFQFSIIKQNFNVEIKGLNTYDADDQMYYLKGYVKTADAARKEKIEKILSASLDDNNVAIKWSHNPKERQHEFRIDSLKRQVDKGYITLRWDGDAIDVDNSDVETIEIPALGDFKVMNVRVIQYPDQYIKIRFSDKLKANQNVRGLITLSGNFGFKYSIDGNNIKAYPESRLTGEKKLSVLPGIRNEKGYKLQDRFEEKVLFISVKPAVEILGEGVIMPSSDGLILPFKAVSLKAVDVEVIKIFENNIPQFLQINNLDGMRELKRVGRMVHRERINLDEGGVVDLTKWNNYSLDLKKMIQADPGALYRVKLSFRKPYSAFSCEENGQTFVEEEIEDWDSYQTAEDSYWDYYDNYQYDWRNRDNPCHRAYYHSGRFKSRNILSSNLGIIAKVNESNQVDVAVTDLITANPVSDARVEVYNFQQQKMNEAKTGADGFVQLKSTDKPYLVIVKKNRDRGYVRLNDGGSLSLSRFDVSGVEVQKGIKGFLYGERGVWRPGDTLHLTFILEDKPDRLPDDQPVIFELTNPRGQRMTRIVKASNVNGFYDFTTVTQKDAPTGNWRAKIRAGGAVFKKTLRIETVKPNRLKINFDFNTKKILPSDKGLEAELKVKWLHGAIAGNLKADVRMILSEGATSFPAYTGYTFDDPAREFNAQEKIIFDDRLNDEGKANVRVNMDIESPAPGMLNAQFLTKVYEEGGDFSADVFSLPFAPYKTFVGIKTPKGDKARGMLLTDQEHEIKIATVDASGEPVSRKGIRIEVYKVKWRWWYESSQEDLASYIGSSYRSPVTEDKINTKDGFGIFNFRIDYPSWGRYLIRAIDAEGHATGKIVYVDWPGWAGKAQRENPGGASMLEMTAEKSNYRVGETAQINIPVGNSGRALVSLERGNKVINKFWVKVDSGGMNRKKIEFDVTKDMTPNVYVNVMLLQPHNASGNDLPLRLYGYVNLNVENPENVLAPLIGMNDELRSGQEFKVRISEANGNPMTYTLAVVDEGLLDLTRFKTPDPYSVFYAREALSVKTWDIYNMVVGAYGGNIEKMFAIGGDEALNKRGKKQANRFEPVVKFLGPFQLEKSEEKTHVIKMPKYIGSVKTMVVAGHEGAYGNAFKTTPVKNPLMLLATLPRVLGPGEVLDIPVTCFLQKEGIQNVKLHIETDDLLEVQGAASKTINFESTGSQDSYFKLRVKEKTGASKVRVFATANGLKADYEVEIDVRNPNPPVVNFVDKVLQPGQEYKDNMELIGLPGSNSVDLEVSGIPPLDLSRRLKHLMKYPHGCIEQTTSAVFPQLYLETFTDPSRQKMEEIEQNIEAGIHRLSGFQLGNGGMSYWPGASTVSEWGTTYAMHFLLEAGKKGFDVSTSVMNGLVDYQSEKASLWSSFDEHFSPYQQAYRLYTLSLSGNPDLAAMNRLKETEDLKIQAIWRLAAAYALAGQKSIARDMTKTTSTKIADYQELGYTYGSALRDHAMILETLTLLDEEEKGFQLLQDISEKLSSEKWLSTQEISYSLIASGKFIDKSGRFSDEINFSYSVVNESEKMVKTRQKIWQESHQPGSQGAISFNFKNRGDNLVYVRIVNRGTPGTNSISSAANNLKMNIRYFDMEGDMLDVSNLPQGTDFKAEVTITNPGAMGDYYNLALTQIFPSGWEIINTRLFNIAHTSDVSIPDYQDVRDDRVYTYFDLAAQRSKTFVIQLNSSYRGKFYLPVVSVEAMYDNRIFSRKSGQWVNVKQRGD